MKRTAWVVLLSVLLLCMVPAVALAVGVITSVGVADNSLITGEDYDNQLEVQYTLSEAVSTLDISILNSSDSWVAGNTYGAESSMAEAGSHTDTLDVSALPAGEYRVRMLVQTTGGQMVIDSNTTFRMNNPVDSLALSNHSVVNNPWNTIDFSFRCHYTSGAVTVDLVSADNTLMQELTFNAADDTISGSFALKDWHGDPLTNGTYTVVVWDNYGNMGALRDTVTLRAPPAISVSGFKVNKTVVNRGASVNLSYTLNTQASAMVRVYKADGTAVRALASGKLQQGNVVLTWNTKDDSGNLVPTGEYIMKASFANGNGTKTLTSSTITVLVPDPNVLTASLSVTPGAVTRNDWASVSIKLKNSHAAIASLKVVDADGDTVRTLETDKLHSTTSSTVKWNLKSDAGKLVAAGKYKVIYTVRDADGKTATAKATLTVKNASKPAITKVKLSKSSVYNYSSTVVTYKISTKSYVTIKVLNSKGKTLYTVTENSLKDAGTYTKRIYASGLTPGKYKVKITAKNSAGSVSEKSSTFTVKYHKPELSGYKYEAKYYWDDYYNGYTWQNRFYITYDNYDAGNCVISIKIYKGSKLISEGKSTFYNRKDSVYFYWYGYGNDGRYYGGEKVTVKYKITTNGGSDTVTKTQRLKD